MLDFLLFTLLLDEDLPAFEEPFLYLDELLLLFDLLETELRDFLVLLLRLFTASSLSLLLLFLFDFNSESLPPLDSRPLSELLPILSIRFPRRPSSLESDLLFRLFTLSLPDALSFRTL